MRLGEDQPKRLRLASFSQAAPGHFGITDYTRRLRLGGSGCGRLWLVGAVDLLADSQTRQRAAPALASRGRARGFRGRIGHQDEHPNH